MYKKQINKNNEKKKKKKSKESQANLHEYLKSIMSKYSQDYSGIMRLEESLCLSQIIFETIN